MDFIVILLVTLVIFHLITFFGAIVIYMLLSLFVYLFGENEKFDEKIIYKIKFYSEHYFLKKTVYVYVKMRLQLAIFFFQQFF